jgi:hypothetical protein
VPLLFATPACASLHYTVHPDALNTADSTAYDTLLIAQAAIDQARVANQTTPLPPDLKTALNTVVQSYNVARESWLTYRGAVATNAPADAYLTQLNNNLLDLSKAIQALKEGQK